MTDRPMTLVAGVQPQLSQRASGFGPVTWDPTPAGGEPQVFVLLPIVDQHVSRCGVLVLFPGKAAPDLDVGAKMLAGPRPLVAGGLRHRPRNAGQNDRLMALDACPKLIEIGYGQEGEVGIRDSSHRLLIDVVGILAATRAEDYLVVGIKVRKHAFHVYKELH